MHPGETWVARSTQACIEEAKEQLVSKAERVEASQRTTEFCMSETRFTPSKEDVPAPVPGNTASLETGSLSL